VQIGGTFNIEDCESRTAKIMIAIEKEIANKQETESRLQSMM
jgi:hypothetical protein